MIQQQRTVGLAEDRQQGARDDRNRRQQNSRASPGHCQLAAAHVADQAKQHERGRQHGLALHDVQRRRHKQRMQQPERGAEQRCERGVARRLAQRCAELAQKAEQQQSIQQVKHDARALERMRIGRPVVGVDQKTQQGDGPSRGIG